MVKLPLEIGNFSAWVGHSVAFEMKYHIAVNTGYFKTIGREMKFEVLLQKYYTAFGIK